jgi:hypothetical protein
MITDEKPASLRELFRAATLMASVCGLATAGILCNTQDPQIIMGTSVPAAGTAFGLWQMARATYHLKKQAEPIFRRNLP